MHNDDQAEFRSAAGTAGRQPATSQRSAIALRLYPSHRRASGPTAASSSKYPQFRSRSRRGSDAGHRQTTAPAGESDRPEHGGAIFPDSVRAGAYFVRVYNPARELLREYDAEIAVRLKPGPGGEDWFEWEERSGPEPLSTVSANDQTLIQVCNVERTPA